MSNEVEFFSQRGGGLMKVKSIFLGALIGALAVFFAAPALAAVGNQGRILYTKDVVRNANGVITQTGNLFVKDLATGVEQQVTNYTTPTMIRNPMFNADGTKIIYTSNVAVGSDTTYKVYIVSADATVSAGVGIELQSGVPTINYTYAALSPDEKTIAFVYDDGTDVSLWTYKRDTGVYQQVYSKDGIRIKDVVFVNNTTVAFIGTDEGIQNIYITDLTGPSTTKLTNNPNANTQYLGLKSGVRSVLAGDLLIYSKRTKPGLSWTTWDVFVAPASLPFIEQNVTNTTSPGQDEYEPCFYGDDSASRDVQLTAQNGNMFYVARVIGTNNKVWQANFDTAGGPTNTGKTQRTADADGDLGFVDWGPPITELAPTIDVTATEVVYTAGSASDAQVNIGDFTSATVLDPILTVTTPGTGIKGNPSLGAARIVYDVKPETTDPPSVIGRMNSDGTNNVAFVDTTTPGFSSFTHIKMPSISPDGKWVFFVAGTTSGPKQIYAKLIDKAVGDAAISLGIGSDAEYPVVSPDMSSLVWVENNLSRKRTINKINIVCDASAETVSTIGSPVVLAGNTSELWDDKNPSFSPDGTKIIFVSNRDGSDRIYTMDAGTGLGVSAFPGLAGITNPAFPQYSPVKDGTIVFVADSGPDRILYSATAAGIASPILNSLGGNIVVTGDKFCWNIERNPGDIVATRTLQSRAAASTTLTYNIKIDVDDGKKPVSYTLEEIIPSWTVTSVKRDGAALTSGTHYYELNNTPVAGLKTLRFVFANMGSGVAGDVSDHILTISVTTAGTGTKSFSGTIGYFMDGSAKSSLVSGNGILNILKPYCPVDIYNSKKEINKPDGVIQDLDLLYGIEAWSSNTQLPGYGTGWPADPNANWDGIILAVIQIWASPAVTQGYYWSSLGGAPAQVNPGDASTKAGEYLFIGDYDGDNTQDVYATSGAISGTAEMYWTQGGWSD